MIVRKASDSFACERCLPKKLVKLGHLGKVATKSLGDLRNDH